MSPLQYLRWRLGTRRAAIGTIRRIEQSGLIPATLADAGARNSEFMRYVAKRWPGAEVWSFDSNNRFKPIGNTFRWVRLGVPPTGTPLSVYRFNSPALLKVDCDADTLNVLIGADLERFSWVVAEVSESGNGSPNNRSDINRVLEAAGFNHSECVDAVVCYLEDRVQQTDVLWWR